MKLYVGNLSFNTTDPDLKDLFAQYGTVTDVHLVTDRMTGKSRGFAFVTMSSVSEGKAAISALEGQNFDGRNLTANEARPREMTERSALLQSRAGRLNAQCSNEPGQNPKRPIAEFILKRTLTRGSPKR